MMTLSTLVRSARAGTNRKRGVTLIEAVLYISIALALIVGGLIFFQQASLSQRTSNAVRSISAIASESRALYQQNNDFIGLTELTLIDSGAVPSNLINTATNPDSLRNEWQGAVDIASNPAVVGNNPPNTTFFVSYAGVPTNACARLTSYSIGNAGRVGSGVLAVGLRAGGSTDDYTAETSANGLELTPADAATACETADSDDNTVDIQYTFAK